MPMRINRFADADPFLPDANQTPLPASVLVIKTTT